MGVIRLHFFTATVARGHSMTSTRNESLQDKLLYPSIPIGFLDDVLQAARYRGLDIEALLQDSGLSSQRLQRAGTRISVDQYSRVLRQLRHETNDAFMGFLSQPLPPRAFNVFCYSVVGCRNLGEVFDQANDFYSLFTDDFRWRLEQQGSDIRLVVDVDPVLPIDYRFIIQSLLLMSLRLFGWLLGEDVEPNSVDFSFDRHATDDSLAYLYGKDINFDCVGNAVVIDGSYSKANLSCTRDQVAMMLQSTRHLFLVSRHKNPLSQEVRRRLLLNRSERWLEIEDVAGQLGLTKHQLWRKLKKEGTSFLDIRDQIKRDWALVLLEGPEYTVEQVSELLRYSDVSAFRKAFKKWTGLQPQQYRMELVS